MKRSHVLSLSAAAALAALPHFASAAAVVGSMQESFSASDYATGYAYSAVTLPSSTQNTGTGWNATGNPSQPNDSGATTAANWDISTTTARPNNFNLGADTSKTIVAGLTYSATGYTAGSGNAIHLDSVGANAALSVGRSLGGQTIDSGTTYFSVLERRDSSNNRTMNLAFFGGTGAQGTETERLGVGEIDAGPGTANGNISILGNNTNPGQLMQTTGTPIAMGTGVTHLLIGKIDWNAGTGGTENITIWVDPTNTTSEASLGTPYITGSQELVNFKYLRVFTGGASTGTAGTFTPVTATFDEIRLGDSLLGVVSTPEPTSLLGLAAVGMLARRRRAL